MEYMFLELGYLRKFDVILAMIIKFDCMKTHQLDDDNRHKILLATFIFSEIIFPLLPTS